MHQNSIKIKSRQDIKYLLKVQMENHMCKFDHHLESQMMSISTPFRGKTGYQQVPLDFLGDLDRLAEDLVTVFILAARKAGSTIHNSELDTLYERIRTLNARPASSKPGKLASFVDDIRDGALDDLVKEAYGQDFACLT
jgi:hypothetical protein